MAHFKITFTASNLSDYFYKKLAEKSTNLERYAYLLELRRDMPTNIKCSLHDMLQMSLAQKVEFNLLFNAHYKTGARQPSYSLEARKGYKLITFIFN